MHDILKEIAQANNFPFFYGRRDFQNLLNDIEQKNISHIFLDPVISSDIDNESGEAEQIRYEGAFMILRSSDIDEVSYEFRYENYIRPILETDSKTIKDSINCNYDAKIETWRKTEIINIFDDNLDGVLIEYSITIDV